MSELEFPNLLSTLQIGPFTLKNRMAVAPHSPAMADHGVLTDAYIAYEIEKARGGAALLIMSVGLSDPLGGEGSIWLSTWRKENVPGFRRIVSTAHDFGCRVFFQFGEPSTHSGLAPSAVAFSGQQFSQSRAMSLADIARMQKQYVVCAEVLAEAGLDGIELHGHGDLFSDFLSPAINRRQDEYGGSFDNRIRYLRESIDAIRTSIGSEMVLGVRLSVDDTIPGSLDLASGVEVAGRLASDRKIDYLNIDISVEPQQLAVMIAPMYVPHGHQVYASAAVKNVVKDIPVICVGRITSPELAEEVLATGQADMVAMARALIADPEFPNKVKEGRSEEIRPCLGDNQECIGRLKQNLPIRCTVNPAVGHEAHWGIGTMLPADRKKVVTVVGGGPAGMETAWVAAARGHRVTLIEQDAVLGGQVLLAERLPGRAEIGGIIRWQEEQLERFAVEVVTGRSVTAEAAASSGADAFVVAAGSTWLKDGLSGLDFRSMPGWEQDHVLSVTDVVANPLAAKGKVLIFDLKGFVEAPGIAEILHDQGNEVEIITPFPSLGTDELSHTLQRESLWKRIILRGIKVSCDSKLSLMQGNCANVIHNHSGEVRTVDDVGAVVVVAGRSANDQLFLDLKSAIPETHIVGDCFRPHNIGSAIRDGHSVGRLL